MLHCYNFIKHTNKMNSKKALKPSKQNKKNFLFSLNAHMSQDFIKHKEQRQSKFIDPIIQHIIA